MKSLEQIKRDNALTVAGSKPRRRTALSLAKAQLEGGVQWGEIIMGTCSLFVCQKCGDEYHLTDGLDPAAFCNDCKDAVLDTLARAVFKAHASDKAKRRMKRR